MSCTPGTPIESELGSGIIQGATCAETSISFDQVRNLHSFTVHPGGHMQAAADPVAAPTQVATLDPKLVQTFTPTVG